MRQKFLKPLACLAAVSVLALGSLPSLPGLHAAAEGGSCGDDATWELSSDGTLTISGSGVVKTIGWDNMRESVKNLVIENGITSIKARSFYGMSSLKTAKLPDNLTEIPMQAFLNCTALEEINMPEKLESVRREAFYGCVSLSSVSFHENLKVVGASSFYGTNLTSVTFEEGLTQIGTKAFALCTLPSVVIPDSVTSIGKDAFGIVYDSVEFYNGKVEGNTYSGSSLCTIYGSEGSAAQQYALENGNPFVNKNHEHSWSEWEVTVEPTCTEPGERTRSCTECGETETEEIPATGEHTFSDWTVTKEATCAEPGERTRSCTVCGETETEEIPATGEHTFSDWTVTKEATCVEPGERTRSCTVCGETETEEIPATGEHTWSEWEIGETQKTRHCTVCGEEQTAPLDEPERVCDSITVEVLQAAYFATDNFAPEQFRVTALVTENGEQTSLDISADIAFVETPAQLAENGQGKATVHLQYTGSDAAVSAYTQNAELTAEITIVLMGDPDADSVITIDDATAALQVYTNEALGIAGGMAPEAFYAADVVKDGVMTIDDAQVILAYYTYEALGMQPTWDELIG